MNMRRTIWLAALALLGGCGGGPPVTNTASPGPEPGIGANAGDGVYCPAVEARVTREDCEDLTRADAEVRPGAAAFNVPDPMRRGQTVQVHLVIDRRSAAIIRRIDPATQADPHPGNEMNGIDPDSNSVAGNRAIDDPGGNAASPPVDEQPPTPGQIVERLEGTPERFYPPVGRHMRAELVGQGFDIVARSEPSQEIPLGGQATWIWDVTAREGGARSLSLITVVEGVANGRRFVLARTPKVRTVTVEVSLSDRIWDLLTGLPGWIKLLTGVIVALGGLLGAWYALPRRKRNEAGRNAMPDGSQGPDADGDG
jgi:hypothetical protein